MISAIMKWTPLAFAGLAATAYADNGAAVTGIVKPDGNAPAGCSPSRDGKFQVTIYSLGKRDVIEKRNTCDSEKTLVMTLQNSVLKDAKDRTGYIASNYQFQFDGPPQAGAIYTAGFSSCSNGSLALGSSTVFYRCLSGSFYNLYDRHWAPQCEPIEIVALPCDGSNPGGNPGNNNPGNGGHSTVGTSMQVTTVVTVLSDGQPQVVPTTIPIPMCQIGDGQVQVHTTPCASAPPVTQISDGQPQGPTNTVAPPPPVSQISDGQPQAPSNAPPPPPVSQISDGQPQAPTNTAQPPPVSQISDGQPQAPTTTAAPPPPVVSQISDGQPQAPTTTAAPPPPVVSQISDGQPQAPTSSNGSVRPPAPTTSAGPVPAGANSAAAPALLLAAAGAILAL
ncbi:covalently-linked cell wall protein [Purpureocillium lavendulum]|uniref:Covalently-linked cell wall protein n=1 Tax=Purpureocillium lavendulum TaxID=1247861 RepID=A0AB34FIE2_9HYPO|nr:covalently-linked cell wall protein [Purpureocillium lavendulum]